MKEPRAVCARCRRPEAVCYCGLVTPIETRTRVVILQHPRERDVPINTVRIASLCLPDAEVQVGVRFEKSLGDSAILLYPGEDAIDVEAHPPVGPVTLVVVDGTWWQARKLVRESPALANLPRYAFRPRAPSDYRIRREPQDDYVSTIEALAHVLGVLEGDAARVSAMLVPFRAMVEAQLAYAARGGGTRHVKKPRKSEASDPRSRLPALVRERARDLVCVHAEANAWPMHSLERRGEELVQWVACRVATGEVLERFIAPVGPLAPSTTSHLEVDEGTLRGGISRAAFDREWAAFLRPDDVIATWGPYAGMLVRLDAPIDLKRVAHQLANAKLGEIEAYVAHLGLDARAPLGHGRAGRRLAQMVAVARALA